MASFPSVRIEGGLLGPDLLDELVAENLPGQRPADFGLEGRRNLTTELAAAFADARAYWSAFEHRLERLQENDLATSPTRDAWVVPLLGLLGYELQLNRRAHEVDGLTFAISHRAGEADESPPVQIVGARQELGRLPLSGRPRLAPHSLVQEYLNRTEQVWGLVTNGLVLRLLRNSSFVRRQAYIEFNLQHILEEKRFADFAVLFRLLHRTRLRRGANGVDECLLDRYYAHSREQGDRVREHLREGVEECIQRLANGFLRYPANNELRSRVAVDAPESERITADNLYRQLLRLVYRLLFLLVSEERGLLSPDHIYREHYGVTRLRRLLDQRAAFTDHDDIWQSLRVLWRVLSDDRLAEVLQLAPLNGELFVPQELDRFTLSNRDLLEAFWFLAWYQEKAAPPRRVNYAALDVEELGSIYESLLDFHPAIDSAGQPDFALIAGSERKTTGSYYTPPQLVAELIRSTLEPVIADRLAAAPANQREQALLSIRVCDPASGSGHFLLAAARRIGKALAQERTGEAEPAPERVREAIRDVIAHCIYGVDKNPLAVDLCRVALWLESHTSGKPLSFLDHRIRCGDSLIGVFDLGSLEAGIPDEAFRPLVGDDKATARELARRNRDERSGQHDLFSWEPDAVLAGFTRASRTLDQIGDDTPEAIRHKKEVFEQSHAEPAWRRQREACDLWTAAFFQPLRTDAPAITTGVVVNHVAGRSNPRLVAMAWDLSLTHRFFHWPLEFPEVFAEGGFDVILGNPPYGAELSKHSKRFITAWATQVKSANNSAAFFVALARHAMSCRARTGFVLPKSLTYSHAWVSTREILLPSLTSVVDLGQAWPNVLLEQILLTFATKSKESAYPVQITRFAGGGARRTSMIDDNLVNKLGIIPTGLGEEDHSLLTVVFQGSDRSLATICSTQRGTAIQKYLQPIGSIPALAGRDIAEFEKPQPARFVNSSGVPDGKLRFTQPPQAVFQNIIAHVTRPRDHLRLIGTVVRESIACVDTVNLLTITEPDVTPQALCGLLMSDLVNWFIYTCVYNRAVRTMHFDGYFLRKISIPSAFPFAELDDVCRDLERCPKSEGAWKAANQLVYDAFGVSAYLRKYVSEMHKPRWR